MQESATSSEKCLTLSGGGAWGSYTLGLVKTWDRDYKLISGISTGALLAPLIALKQYDKLEKAYTNVGLKDVFNVCPFKDNGDIHWFRVMRRIMGAKNSAGEMYPLRDNLIPAFYSKDDHKRLQESGKEVLVHSVNIGLNPAVFETFSSCDTEYEVFTAAMFASCCFWPVSNIAMVNGFEHVDGGWMQPVVIDQIINKGYKNIDVVLLRPKKQIVEVEDGYFRNMFKTFPKIFGAMRSELTYENLERACSLAAKDDEMNINVYYTPKVLSNNAMNFNKEEMQSWVRLGEQLAFDKSICESF